MPTKTSVDKVEQMLHPTLEETFDPQSMIALVPIHNDHKVADIGAGPGWLSIPIAKYVYSGTCYAVDVQKDMLKFVEERSTEAKLETLKHSNPRRTQFRWMTKPLMALCSRTF